MVGPTSAMTLCILSKRLMEFGQQDFLLICTYDVVIEPVDLLDVDQDRAALAQDRQCGFKRRVRSESAGEAHHTDAFAAERIGIERRTVIALALVGLDRGRV